MWRVDLGFRLGGDILSQSLKRWIDDGLMAVFFLVIGLEIKREVLVGHLSSVRKAALPAIAALGGMLVPAAVFLAVNAGGEGFRGWAIPAATDIAFALGVAALLGGRVSRELVVFLGALATVDDIGAMLVIALFYGSGISWMWLGVAALLYLMLVGLNRVRVDALWPYLAIGIVFWFAFLNTGLHATVAGVLVALVIPAHARISPMSLVAWGRLRLDKIAELDEAGAHVLKDDRQQEEARKLGRAALYSQAPLQRLEHALKPVTYLLILPLFALANAGIHFSSTGPLELLQHRTALGIMQGLVLGKPLGIVLFSWLAVRLGVSSLPGNARWRHLLGMSWLGGIGFTMSLFITNLAFGDAGLADEARMAILTGSLLAALVAFAYLRLWGRTAHRSDPRRSR